MSQKRKEYTTQKLPGSHVQCQMQVQTQVNSGVNVKYVNCANASTRRTQILIFLGMFLTCTNANLRACPR